MKNTYIFTLLLLHFTVFSLAQNTKEESFNPKKHGKMIEIDVKNIFSNFGPGSNLLYRTKHESSDFVFVDRTRYWRLGLYINGSGELIKSNRDDINVNSDNAHGFFFAPSIGHETMFHFGRFNLFYAYGLSPYYQYIDITNGSKTPCIAHSVGLSIFGSGGMRYFLHDRFSISVESTPLGLTGYYKRTKFYKYYDPNTGRSIDTNLSTNSFGFNVGQTWLNSIGFTYHF